ncbi:MAG: HpcH/HpaI aldolase family protein [Planktomarina sp.]
MPAPENHLKHALARGEQQFGIWLALASPSVAELAATIEYDWLLIDAEHGPNDLPRIEAQLRAMAHGNATPIVRVPHDADWILKQVLDLGVQTVLVPMVNTAEQARAVVAACKYAPEGHRGVGYALTRASGFNSITDYGKTANDQICVIVQVETEQAMQNIDEIAAVPGVDCVFIGPADLSADMGYFGQPDHPAVVKVIDQGIASVVSRGKPIGTILFDANQHADFLAKGGTFLGVGADSTCLTEALSATLGKTKDIRK